MSKSNPPKLIVGLGNLGHEYQLTRHNIGFFTIDEIAQEFGASFSEKSKFKGDVAEFTIGETKVILLKSTTYYNLTGEAVRAVKDFYKIENADILAIHDELAIPFGTIRIRIGGSSAGNNGIKSITEHIGEDYTRIRIGVWNELRDRMQDADFVLSRFNRDEQAQLPLIADHVRTMVEGFVQDKLDHHTITV
jgi:PTH1 family peptidyl-tRNA hydrolase